MKWLLLPHSDDFNFQEKIYKYTLNFIKVFLLQYSSFCYAFAEE